MDEDLSLYTTELSIEMPEDENVEASSTTENINNDPWGDETADGFDGATVDEIEMEIGETMGWSGGDVANHYGLYDRNDPDQHEISAITGLREELDEIKSLKTVYSDKFNIANYYKWADNNQYDTYGYFVSIVPDSTEINICTGTDIFGVTVDAAGFVGGQDDLLQRDASYALVATSGLVCVRCETSVDIGHYIVSNKRGWATKTSSGYGYKVLDVKNDNGIKYAVIALSVQADTIRKIGEHLDNVEQQVDINTSDIISATNAANQALNKVLQLETSNQTMSTIINTTTDKVDNMSTTVQNLSTQVSNSNKIANQAKELVNRVVDTTTSITNSAIVEANNAIKETREIRDGFNNTVNQVRNEVEVIKANVGNVSGEFADIVRQVNQNTTQIGLITGFDNDNAEGLAGVVSDVSRHDAELIDHQAKLMTFAQWQEKVEGGTIDSIATIRQTANDNAGAISTLTQYRTEDLGVIAGIQQTASDNQSNIETLTEWQGAANDAFARIEQKADENGAYIQSTVSNRDTHSVGPHSPAYEFTIEQAASWLEEGMIYAPANEDGADLAASIIETYKISNHAVEWIEDDRDITKVYYKFTGEGDNATKEYWYFGYDEENEKYDWIPSAGNVMPSVQRQFLPTYLYKWGRVGGGDGPYGWITVDKSYEDTDKENNSKPAVRFQISDAPAATDSQYGYWYTSGANLSGTAASYEPYTLYKSISYKKTNLDGTVVRDDEDKIVLEYKWAPVATLAGNSKNMVISQVRQDTNSIEARVTNAEGSIASSKQWIDDNSANVQDWVDWKDDNAESIATFMATAEDNFASTSQVAQVVDNNGNITAASIVAAVNGADSSVTIDANHLQFGGQSFELAIQDIADAAVDNIELGGRNLLSNSDFLYTCDNKKDYGPNNQTLQLVQGYDIQNLIGKTLSFSYFVHSPGERNSNTNISWGERFGMHGAIVWTNNSGQTTVAYPFSNYLITSESNERVKMTYDVVAPAGYPYLSNLTITYQPHAKPATGNTETWKIGYPKLEIGNKATDWTPAPEDMVDKKNIIASIRGSAEGIQIQGDKVDIAGNAVFKSLTSIENGQTVIDGGKIMTGSISVDRLKAGSLNAEQIAAGAITADKIASKTITSEEIATRTITAEEIAVGTITADNMYIDELSSIAANLGSMTAGEILSTNYTAPRVIIWGEAEQVALQNDNESIDSSNVQPALIDEESEIMAVADNLTPSQGLEFALSDNGAYYIVYGIGDCKDTDVVIPTEYNSLPVTVIGMHAFDNNRKITSIVIPDGITTIEEYAFTNCTYLKSASVSNSVINIGNNAFSGCTRLKSVTIGNKVANIGRFAFNGCTELDNIVLPDSVTSLGVAAFQGCRNLTSVNIPNGITSIQQLFMNCISLKDIVLPDSIITIGDHTFSSCTSLEHIHIPDGVTSMGGAVFSNCTSLGNITIPQGVTQIGSLTFENCSSLTSVTIPNSVTSIGSRAFYKCVSLTNVTIPDQVTNIASNTFFGCTSLVYLSIPASVISIGSISFGNCSALQTITYLGSIDEWLDISKNVNWSVNFTNYTIQAVDGKILEDGTVIYECSVGLDYLLNGDGQSYSVIGIGTCTDMDIVIPARYQKLPVITIGAKAFYECGNIASITIPLNITTIGQDAFTRCTNIREIYFNAIAMSDLSQDNRVFYDTGTQDQEVKVIIGKNVTKIPAYLFNPMSSVTYTPYITSIEFEEGSVCTSIGDYAFAYCRYLKTITIPDNIKNIGSSAFSTCSGLEEIRFNAILMNDLLSGNNVFYSTRQKKTIRLIIGKNVTRIPAYLFYPINQVNARIASVEFEDGSVCKSIGCYAFQYNEDLTHINIPDGIEIIEQEAFGHCSQLETVVIPDSVTTIGRGAFWYCGRLTCVTIPKNVTSMGQFVFAGCFGLTKIYFNAISLTDVSYICTTDQNSNDIELIIGSEVTRIPSSIFYQSPVATIKFAKGSLCETIESNAFALSPRLVNVQLYHNVKTIGEMAFYRCSNLTDVAIGRNVETIGRHAFADCTCLTNVTISRGVKNIEYGAFQDCTRLESITIPSTVTTMGGFICADCSSLRSVVISPGLKTIAYSAFEGCRKLESIVIPDSVRDIGGSAFGACTHLKYIYYQGTSTELAQINIGDLNEHFYSATTYFYSENEPDDEGNYWRYDFSGLKISSDDYYVIESNNFKVTADGDVYANNGEFHGLVYADGGEFTGKVIATEGEFTGKVIATEGEFHGNIHADGGDIGGLEIDNGIKGRINNTETFSLSKSGLILGAESKINVGNVELYHDGNQSRTFINTNGPLSLCSKQNGDIITSIDLMTDVGEDRTTYTLELHCDSGDTSDLQVYLKTSNDVRLKNTVNITLYYQGAKVSMTGNYDYSDSLTRTMPLTINGGESQSETVKLSLVESQDDVGFWGTRVRFKCWYDGVWLSDWFADKKVNSSLEGLVGTCGSITQSQTKASIMVTGNLIPLDSNRYSIGRADDGNTNLWSTIYAQTGTIQQSDKTHKNHIQNLSENYSKIFDGLQAVSYKFNENTSNRTHLGFIAQDVKKVVEDCGLSTQDFAGYCEWKNSNGEIGCGLRYEEFIALCVDQIQKLKKRVEELETKLNTTQND